MIQLPSILVSSLDTISASASPPPAKGGAIDWQYGNAICARFLRGIALSCIPIWRWTCKSHHDKILLDSQERYSSGSVILHIKQKERSPVGRMLVGLQWRLSGSFSRAPRSMRTLINFQTSRSWWTLSGIAPGPNTLLFELH